MKLVQCSSYADVMSLLTMLAVTFYQPHYNNTFYAPYTLARYLFIACMCAFIHSFIHSLDFKVLGPTMTIGPVV